MNITCECDHSSVYNNRTHFNNLDFECLPEPGHGVRYQGKAKLVIATLRPNRHVVVKGVLACINADASELQKAIDREITVLCILKNKSPNIHPILGTVTLNPYMPPSPVFELCNEGTIMQHISNSGVEGTGRLRLLKDVVEGVKYIHNQDIIHGDLKGPNILIGNDDRARICDFGSAFVERCECIAGRPNSFGSIFTSQYMSPEVWQSDEDAPATKMSDIWALGCVMLEVQLGIKPYGGPRTGTQALVRMASQRFPATSDELAREQSKISVEVVGLIRRCWEYDPEERPSAQEVDQELQRILDLGLENQLI
ncbi:hypothetical protein FRC08_002665 [Ceratobasidium sp. 394]|nr:hypothetical protein FRC08_002665 [Ceratobasidium sp. 394]